MLEYEEVQVCKAKAMAYVLEFNTTKSFEKLLSEYPWISLPLHQINLEEIRGAKLETKLANLAMSKAEETQQDVGIVFMEIQHQVSVKFAEYLEPTIDPILAALKDVELEEDEEDGRLVCGVCQDEMVPGQNIKAMACMHSFHIECIYKWLKLKLECPLCRSKHEI